MQAGCHVLCLTYTWLAMAAALSLVQCSTSAKQGQAGLCRQLLGAGLTPKCISLPGGWLPAIHPHRAATAGSLKVTHNLLRRPAVAEMMCVSSQGVSFWMQKQDISSNYKLQSVVYVLRLSIHSDHTTETFIPLSIQNELFLNARRCKQPGAQRQCSLLRHSNQQAKSLGTVAPRERQLLRRQCAAVCSNSQPHQNSRRPAWPSPGST